MAQCPVGWSGSWSPSVTICITAQQRSRNASVIVPELAEIGDNYEFVNQFRPLWSAARAQDVKFCDEKTEQLFLGQQTSQEIVCLIARPS